MIRGFTSGTICGRYVRATNAENKNPAAFTLPPNFLLEGNYGATVGVPTSAGGYGVTVNIEVGMEKSVGVEVYFWMIVGMTVGV